MEPSGTKLSPFEDVDVVSSRIEIPDAAGGLREALKVEPVQLHIDDELHVVLHCRVKKVRFDPAGKGHEGELTRVHVLETLEAAFIDADQVAEHIRENVDRVKREVERLAGVQRLDDAMLDDDEQSELDAENEAAMIQAHKTGLHPQSTVAGCPSCAERELDREADKRGRADLD